MTFSILAVDGTGAIGSAICSSSPAVAARCVTLEDGVGGAHSQNITDPRLGPRLLRLVREGRGPRYAIKELTDREPTAEYRQLLVIDARGRTAVHSGTRTLGVHGAARGPHSVAAGNMLRDERIPQLMVDAFESATGELETRLLSALTAAVGAGGEAGPVRSAGVSVVRAAGWRVTDLRIDWHDTPVEELGRLLDTVWLPQRDDYVTRGIDPSRAPAYGVPGGE
ncbi:DUF1028 domain-containing protein [Streptomyces sp. NPDC056716]|uniref:DUF1028 domain-containing protein n=1 Tax=unclassified Streptomyces TaxID=2593676 RepID=UPI00369B920F